MEEQKQNPGDLFQQPPTKEKTMTEKKEDEVVDKTTGEITKSAPVEKQKPPQASNVPAQKITREQQEALRLQQINRMTVMQLVQDAPKTRFISALVGNMDDKVAVAKAEMEFAKEASFAMQFFADNEYLTTCARNDKQAVIDAIINVAQTGLTLNPVLKLGYLIPMDKKVRFWASYMGKREIVMRTGLVKDAYAKLVYDGEEFEIKYGTGGFLKHTPDPWKKRELKDIKGGYWVCVLKDGTEKFGTMNADEITAIQKRSPSAKASHSPWGTDYEQMALKTIFNRGFKEMPKSGISDDQLKALEASDKVEEDMLKHWVRTQKTKQDTFDDDYEDGQIVGNVE